MDGPALPGAEEWNPASLQRHQCVGSPGRQWPLTDDDGPGPGPGIEPRRIRGPSAMVRRADRTNT